MKADQKMVGFGANNGYPSEDLGNYIFALDPYGAVRPPASAWTVPYPPAMVTIETDPKKYGYLYFMDTSGIETHETPGLWKFKYADHYVKRALRIPYMYYAGSNVDPTQGVLVRDFFLIGFEGGGGY